MPGSKPRLLYSYSRCLRASRRHHGRIKNGLAPLRSFTTNSPLQSPPQDETKTVRLNENEDHESIEAQILNKPSTKDLTKHNEEEPKQSAMSQRLSEATEEALLTGGRAGRKAIEEAGFSEELKDRLLEKVRAAEFRSENASAFAEANFSSHVGRGSADVAAGQAWTGTETPEDSMLRMLDDARKPLQPGLRGPARIPKPVDMRIKREPKARPGQRLAHARDKSSVYAISKDTNMSDEERQKMRQELKERFAPAARAMPNTLSGLAALANERIEDAIARGQFKNIPRGKGIERDARADNPFIDTTEYIMNKMIQRQDIVPPWIEKQQELVKTANIFRARLRNDWKRHAARTIASIGGSLQEQMSLADRYAESERVHNPKKRAVEQISVPTNATDDPVMVKIIQEAPSTGSDTPIIQVALQDKQEDVIAEAVLPVDPVPALEPTVTPQSSPNPLVPLPPPFRIPSWESAEISYLNLAIANLNSITRSYNLMAPDLAKKPYFSLDRELKACYADVAPQLAEAIKERAARPAKELVEKIGHKPGSVFERFASDKAQIYDSKRPLYGWKEFWSDLWSEKRA